MTPRARRIAIALAALALLLSLGRSGSLFLADRLWEATVSEAVAAAGSRRALQTLGLELAVVLLSIVWFAIHFSVAARLALPDRPPPEREHARLWPGRLPRWTVLAAAAVLGILLGGGAGQWLDELLLTLDGVRFGVTDPLLGADLGVFLRDFPLWLDLQARVTLLAGAALIGVVLLHVAGRALRIVDRRVWVSPHARGHLAILLAVLGLALAWGSALEPFRLAAGMRGPLLASEFLLRTLVAEVEAGLGAATAVASLLWWFRVRGTVAFGAWLLYAMTLLAGRVLPLHTEAAAGDDGWRTSARGLDSVAYGLATLDGPRPAPEGPALGLLPSLWDSGPLQGSVGDSVRLDGTARGWIQPARGRRPVWFAVRLDQAEPLALLALSDDEVSPAGGLLFWHPTDPAPNPGARAFLELPSSALRPGAPLIATGTDIRGVALRSWPQRVMLAWALQTRAALSAPTGNRLAWRLDPLGRLRAVAPFAHWSEPRPQLADGKLVWTSDGLLTARYFPSSLRLTGAAGSTAPLSMIRGAFVGLVDAETGSVRLFRADRADSLSAAWARITAPLIEPRSDIPPGIRGNDPYPAELLDAQVKVLQGPAWRVGRLEGKPEDRDRQPAAGPGGTDIMVPFTEGEHTIVKTFLSVRRTGIGDELRLVHADSIKMESPRALDQRWERFPFRQQLRDSIRATGAELSVGQVRYSLAQDGIVAYQPAWAVSQSGRAQLVLVNVALAAESQDQRVGVGRTFPEAWGNLRVQLSPGAVGTGANAILEQARRWMRHADSALRRSDLQEFGRALAYLRDLLEPPGAKPIP